MKQRPARSSEKRRSTRAPDELTPESPTLHELELLRQRAIDAVHSVAEPRGAGLPEQSSSSRTWEDAPAGLPYRANPKPSGESEPDRRPGRTTSPTLIELELLNRSVAAALVNITSGKLPPAQRA